MERIQSINSERIVWCCADYGITPFELAQELGLSQSSMSRVLAEGGGITFKQLRKMADFFGRGVLFFLESGPVNERDVHTTQFRTLSNQKPELSPTLKKLIERVEKQRAIYLSLLEDLDETSRLRFFPPRLSRSDLKAAANIVRNWLGLTDENHFDTYRTAVEEQGILVFRSNGYHGKWQIPKQSPILGFTLYDTSCPVIVIKKLPWDTQQSFTLMHELGHLLLDKSSSIDDENDFYSQRGHERDANAFAGYLLVPDRFLVTIRDSDRPTEVSQYDDWLEPQRKSWGISNEVILRRLLDEGRLPQSSYALYRQWRAQTPFLAKTGGTRVYRYREPKHVFGDSFVRTVLDALNGNHISLAKASTYLDSLKIKDLHQLESHYAGL